MQYQWDILQTGEISYRPDGSRDTSQKHTCTSTILWRADKPCIPLYSIITDPCFIGRKSQVIEKRLEKIGFKLPNIGKYYITHAHWDHQPRLHHRSSLLIGTLLDIIDYKGLQLIPCPGHQLGQNALAFTDSDNKQVWIVGDAILNEEWLRAWAYFWPNNYVKEDIIEHWHNIATIFTDADIIIPGHGSPFTVTSELIEVIIETFPKAEYAKQCTNVLDTLKARLEKMK